MKKREIQLSIHDLEGSVAEMISHLQEYPADARIEIKEEAVYAMMGGPAQWENVIVIRWSE